MAPPGHLFRVLLVLALLAAPGPGAHARDLDQAEPSAPASAPAPLLPAAGLFTRGTTLQPGEPGYKSPAVGAGWSFGATLLPVIVGSFAVRVQSTVTVWFGYGLIVAAHSFGPSAGYWYAEERATFTWQRFLLTMGAFGAGIYPLYAYTGRIDSYHEKVAALLVTVAIAAEAGALALAAWDLNLLGETIERHNFKPPRRSAAWQLGSVVPVAYPGGGGVALGGRF